MYLTITRISESDVDGEGIEIPDNAVEVEVIVDNVCNRIVVSCLTNDEDNDYVNHFWEVLD